MYITCFSIYFVTFKIGTIHRKPTDLNKMEIMKKSANDSSNLSPDSLPL